MKKILLSLLAIMMVFVFVACENPAGGKDYVENEYTVDAEAVVKECTVDIDSFAPSAGTWKLQRIEFEGGAEFNKTLIRLSSFKIQQNPLRLAFSVNLRGFFSFMDFHRKVYYYLVCTIIGGKICLTMLFVKRWKVCQKLVL